MKKSFLFLCLLLVVFSNNADARRVRSHTEEDILFLADTSLRADNGKQLYLGHKVSMTKALGLSFFIESEGLVLGVTGERAYISLPEGEQLRLLQSEGKLPNPLPSAKLGVGQRLKGYLGWIILVVIFAGIFWSARKRDKENSEYSEY
jgi:hypothetical protein